MLAALSPCSWLVTFGSRNVGLWALQGGDWIPGFWEAVGAGEGRWMGGWMACWGGVQGMGCAFFLVLGFWVSGSSVGRGV